MAIGQKFPHSGHPDDGQLTTDCQADSFASFKQCFCEAKAKI
jgi:hypothetical protein